MEIRGSALLGTLIFRGLFDETEASRAGLLNHNVHLTVFLDELIAIYDMLGVKRGRRKGGRERGREKGEPERRETFREQWSHSLLYLSLYLFFAPSLSLSVRHPSLSLPLRTCRATSREDGIAGHNTIDLCRSCEDYHLPSTKIICVA
jgi:hypothetical protein